MLQISHELREKTFEISYSFEFDPEVVMLRSQVFEDDFCAQLVCVSLRASNAQFV